MKTKKQMCDEGNNYLRWIIKHVSPTNKYYKDFIMELEMFSGLNSDRHDFTDQKNLFKILKQYRCQSMLLNCHGIIKNFHSLVNFHGWAIELISSNQFLQFNSQVIINEIIQSNMDNIQIKKFRCKNLSRHLKLRLDSEYKGFKNSNDKLKSLYYTLVNCIYCTLEEYNAKFDGLHKR